MPNWFDLSSSSNTLYSTYVQGFLDISGGDLITRNLSKMLIGGDASINSNLFIQNSLGVGGVNTNYKLNVSGNSNFTKNVYIGGDLSINAGNLFVAGDVSINGYVNVANYAANSIPISALNGGVNATYTNDISMQKRLFVSSGDISFNNIPTVATDFNVNDTATSLDNKIIVPGSIRIVDNSVNNIYGSYVNFSNNAGTAYYNVGKSKSNLFNIVNQGNIGVYLQSSGTTFTSTSDIRLKTNIKPIESAVDKIMQLKPCYYNWKNQDDEKENVGFIAQEVEEILPNLVHTIEHPDGDDYKGVNITDLIPYLVKVIQEQTDIINDLQSKIMRR